jgi:hypothetical protein
MSLCAFATEIAGDPGPYCLSTTKSNRPIASSCACHHLVLFSLAMFMALAANVQAQTSPVLSVAGPTEIRFGDQPQYTALLDGASGSAVSWAVNGFVGGTGSTGPISASGVFSPASTIFAGHSVTISAKTGASPVTSASIMVRVLNPLPRITSGSIAQTVPGSFLLDVHGGGFVAASQLFVAGVTVSTIFVSSAELRSTIQLSAGTTAISAGVLNPNAEQKSLVSVNLPVPLPKLMVMPAGLSFGEVATQTAAVEPVTLSSSGQAPVIIQSGSLSGSGFSLTGATFPVTLNPGLAITLEIQFAPTALGTVTGQLLISSNSSIGPAAAITLSGTGIAPVAISISPLTISVPVATTRQFLAAVTGTPNTAVVWALSGSGCGGAACGAISSSGLYTAPAVAPVTGTVTVTATAQADPAKSATAVITINSNAGARYYLATRAQGGNDANSGLSAAAPWLTPNHPVACGDVILAAAGTYNNADFGRGRWGAVSCPANNSVAWLACAVFDTCKISVASGLYQGMNVDASYWGVQGWEISTTGATLYGTCFSANPSSAANIHHIIFANDIANGCAQSGFSAYGLYNGTGSVDYIAYLGNIAWNSTQGSDTCTSGFNIAQPAAADAVAGTHIYVAGNFSYDNRNPAGGCAGTAPTDGEGINFDTWDDGGDAPYTQQGVVENNIEFLNGGFGIEVEKNNAGSVGNAHIYILNNTMYGDRRDNAQVYCLGNGDLDLFNADNVTASGNLIYTGYPTNCSSDVWYAMSVALGNSSDSISGNFAAGFAGNNTFVYESPGFAFAASNVLGANPNFVNPVDPGPPACGGYSSVAACMATVIANFTPALNAARSYGYQAPVPDNLYDSFFPQWLCTAHIPSGLVSMACSVP